MGTATPNARQTMTPITHPAACLHDYRDDARYDPPHPTPDLVAACQALDLARQKAAWRAANGDRVEGDTPGMTRRWGYGKGGKR